MQLGDSLAEVGQTKNALLAYEREVFVSPDPTVKNLALLKKAQLLKQNGEFGQAKETLQRANFFLGQDSLNFKLRYELVLNAFLADDFNLALAQVSQMQYFYKDKGYEQVMFLHILTLNELRRWVEAKAIYQQYYDLKKTIVTPDEAYSFLGKLKIKDPEKAEKISYILPGVGQMYAGYFGRGLLSSVIQLSLISYGAYSLYEGYFFTGALTGVGLFWAFYTGGTRHAKYLAEKKNEEVTRKHNDYLKEIVLAAEGQ